jgi:hypothetical protein
MPSAITTAPLQKRRRPEAATAKSDQKDTPTASDASSTTQQKPLSTTEQFKTDVKEYYDRGQEASALERKREPLAKAIAAAWENEAKRNELIRNGAESHVKNGSTTITFDGMDIQLLPGLRIKDKDKPAVKKAINRVGLRVRPFTTHTISPSIISGYIRESGDERAQVLRRRLIRRGIAEAATSVRVTPVDKKKGHENAEGATSE